jgi:hypothetical protein
MLRGAQRQSYDALLIRGRPRSCQRNGPGTAKQGFCIASRPGQTMHESGYAGTLSGNTASILFFSVAALNGLTM